MVELWLKLSRLSDSPACVLTWLYRLCRLLDHSLRGCLHYGTPLEMTWPYPEVISRLEYLSFWGITKGSLVKKDVTALIPGYVFAHFLLCFQIHLFLPTLLVREVAGQLTMTKILASLAWYSYHFGLKLLLCTSCPSVPIRYTLLVWKPHLTRSPQFQTYSWHNVGTQKSFLNENVIIFCLYNKTE